MQAVHIKLCKHENMHAHTQAAMQTRTRLHPPTFLQRLANFDIAVCSLELIEEGADFEFVRDSLAELWHDSAVLPRGADFEHSPLAPLRPLR